MAAGVTLRAVRPSDREAWVAMRCALWPRRPPGELSEEVDAFLRGGSLWGAGAAPLPSAAWVAADAQGRLLGFVEASLRPFAEECRTSPVGYLEGWFVEPWQRRRGIGGRLVRAAEAWARAHGCLEMASDAHVGNEVSGASHRALGYEEVDRTVHFRRELRRRRAGSRRRPRLTRAA